MQRSKHLSTVRNASAMARRVFLAVEQLESRLTPYAVTGNAWPHPELISLSFMPDGTNLGGVTSNLFATMNANWATAVWQKEMLRAAQVWAQQTNINFTVVSDDGSDTGSGLYQQGAPNFGDIRMGAYNSGSGLGMATLPPPVNNYSAAGDYTLNSAQPWKINQTGGYDLFTVAAHEAGHTLGLGHSAITSAVMFTYYNALKSSLRPDDISGIRAIYSAGAARAQDSYDAAASNGSFATATDVTGSIQGDLTALFTDRDITTTTDLDYYRVTVPAGTTGTLVVKLQSSGLSLLSPLVKVYDANQVEIGLANGLNQYGATLTVTINGVSAGQQFFVMVDGADQTAFGTGKYAMTLNFGSAANPTVPLPNTQTANGNPIQGGGGTAQTPPDHRDPDNNNDQDQGVPVVETNDAILVQFLTGGAATQTVTTQAEHLRELPTIAAVDAVFLPPATDSTTAVAETSRSEEAGEVDTVFAEMFA